jgi:hypothetical protein
MTTIFTKISTSAKLAPRMFAALVLVVSITHMCEGAELKDFRTLTNTEQVEYLKATLQKFRNQVKNISAKVSLRSRNVQYDRAQNKLGEKVIFDFGKRVYDFRRIGESFRLAVEPHPAVREPGTDYPSTTEHYDAEAGRNRNLTIVESLKSKTGTISTNHTRAVGGCFFPAYIGGAFKPTFWDDAGGWFLTGSAKCKVVNIDEASGVAIVDVPFPKPRPDQEGQCLVSFDFNKQGLLVARELTRVVKPRTKNERSIFERLEITESISVNSVWVPSKMKVIAWSSVAPTQATVHDIEIADIKLGTVKSSDLEVTFPPGTEVNDELTGTHFAIGPDGEEKPSSIFWAKSDRSAVPVQDQQSSTSYSVVTWVLGAITAILLIGVILKRKKAKP